MDLFGISNLYCDRVCAVSFPGPWPRRHWGAVPRNLCPEKLFITHNKTKYRVPLKMYFPQI